MIIEATTSIPSPRWKPVFNPLFDYHPSQTELERMSYQQMQSVCDFKITRNQMGWIQFMGPVDLTNMDFLNDVLIDHGVVGLYPNEECSGLARSKLNQTAFNQGSLQEIVGRLKAQVNVRSSHKQIELVKLEQSRVQFIVHKWCHYRIFGEGPAPPKPASPKFNRETRDFEVELSDNSQEGAQSKLRSPFDGRHQLAAGAVNMHRREPQKLHRGDLFIEEEKTGIPEEEKEPQPEAQDPKYQFPRLEALFESEASQEEEEVAPHKKDEREMRERRVLQLIVSHLWVEFKHSSPDILQHFDELSNFKLPESKGQQAPPQFYEFTHHQSYLEFLKFFEKVNRLLSKNTLKDTSTIYEKEIRLLSLLSVLKKGVYLKGQQMERTIEESMIVRNHLLDWLREYVKKDLNMQQWTLPERIRAAVFLEDMPWLEALRTECKVDNPILSKIIRSIIRKKSYVHFPQRQKQEYIQKLLNVEDIGIDIHQALRLVLYKEEIHMCKEDWKLKLFYDLVHNPQTAHAETLRSVLPQDPASENQEQALIFYHFTDANQSQAYLKQIINHTKGLHPLIRLILLYYIGFVEEIHKKGSEEERKKIHEYLEEAYNESQELLLRHKLTKESFIVSFLLIPLKMSSRFDQIVSLVKGFKKPEKMKAIFNLFEQVPESQFLDYLQGEYALSQNNYRLAMSSFLKSRHVMKSYRVFMDRVVVDFVAIFPWERVRVPFSIQNLSQDEMRSLEEIKGRIDECSKLKHHFLKEWEMEGSKYQEFFSIAFIIVSENVRAKLCHELHKRISILDMEANVSEGFMRLGEVLARWRREISLYNATFNEEKMTNEGLYLDEELDSFNIL